MSSANGSDSQFMSFQNHWKLNFALDIYKHLDGLQNSAEDNKHVTNLSEHVNLEDIGGCFSQMHTIPLPSNHKQLFSTKYSLETTKCDSYMIMLLIIGG